MELDQEQESWVGQRMEGRVPDRLGLLGDLPGSGVQRMESRSKSVADLVAVEEEGDARCSGLRMVENYPVVDRGEGSQPVGCGCRRVAAAEVGTSDEAAV